MTARSSGAPLTCEPSLGTFASSHTTVWCCQSEMPSFPKMSTETPDTAPNCFHYIRRPDTICDRTQYGRILHFLPLLGTGTYVKPKPPIQFQKPIHQPSVRGAGRYHFVCVSIMKSAPEMMKPVPPTTCGVQYSTISTGRDMWLMIPGKAVKPEISKMLAASI